MAGTQVAAGTRPDKAPAATARQGWIDALRVTAIAGVVVMHAATAYILDIDWSYQERTSSAVTPHPGGLPGPAWQPVRPGAAVPAGRPAVGGIAGPQGPGGFARGRLLRLGLPLLAFFVPFSDSVNV